MYDEPPFLKDLKETLQRTSNFGSDRPAIPQTGVERARSAIICGEEWRISPADDQNS